ncbi:hypothetical protein IMZ48_22685, partial [Candidatus Bathyarchaeota archaeon]|nr:hypothetical protein [Candidatus Bathyarchaeota archaeon]
MSTPTTATATLPHYHHRHHYPYQPGGSTATTYRTNGLPPPHSTTTNQILLSPSSSSARLPPAFPTTPSAQYSPSTLTTDSRTLPVPNTNGLTPSSTASSRPSYALGNLPPAPNPNYPTTMGSSNPAPRGQGPRRQRSREPDWNKFYKNGLPDEIIVIDDTPEPEAGRTSANQPSHHIVNGNGAATAYANSATTTMSRPPVAKKRKRDGEIDSGYYTQKYGTSVASTPHVNGTATGTISTDRTTARTAAATSLSSGSQYDY